MMALNFGSRSASLLALLVVASLLSEGQADIECYVCSFNPYEVLRSADSENATQREPEWWQLGNDTCTWERFDATRTRTTACDRGCEIVKMTDGNGELEMFYRNCLTRPEVTYDLVKTRNRLNEEEVYTCDSKLCNGSQPTVTCEAAGIVSATAAAVVLVLRARTTP